MRCPVGLGRVPHRPLISTGATLPSQVFTKGNPQRRRHRPFVRSPATWHSPVRNDPGH